jgi:hypothetical protein
MVLSRVVLIALGSLVAGLLLGLLFINMLQRIQKKRHALFQKKTNLIKTETSREPVTTTLNRLIFKSEGRKEDTLEILVKNHKNTATAENQKQSPRQDVLSEPEIIDQKNAPIVGEQKQSPKSDFLKELETNLATATTPWADKLLPFETSLWDSTHGEGEPLLVIHHQELIQVYVDIGLANNIVWLSTEIGHRSKELDESYIKLCAGIAERLKRVMPH